MASGGVTAMVSPEISENGDAPSALREFLTPTYVRRVVSPLNLAAGARYGDALEPFGWITCFRSPNISAVSPFLGAGNRRSRQ